MGFNYLIYWLKNKWEDVIAFWRWLLIQLAMLTDKLNIFLAKHDMVKVFTIYDVFWYDVHVGVISTYDVLSKHYDNLVWQANNGSISGIGSIKDWELKFKSRKSLISNFFKVTLM